MRHPAGHLISYFQPLHRPTMPRLRRFANWHSQSPEFRAGVRAGKRARVAARRRNSEIKDRRAGVISSDPSTWRDLSSSDTDSLSSTESSRALEERESAWLLPSPVRQ